MEFIKKRRIFIAWLLIALFSIGIKQTCLVDFGNKAEHSNAVLKTSPFIAGNASYSHSERAHHHALFFPVKILFLFASSLKSVTPSKLLYLIDKTAQSGATFSILGLICKLQI